MKDTVFYSTKCKYSRALLQQLDQIPWAQNLTYFSVDPDPVTNKRNKDLLHILEISRIPSIYFDGRQYAGTQAFELIKTLSSQGLQGSQGSQGSQQSQRRDQLTSTSGIGTGSRCGSGTGTGSGPQEMPQPQHTRVQATGMVPTTSKPSMEPNDLSLLAPIGADGPLATFDSALYGGDTSGGHDPTFDPSRGANTRTSAPPLGSQDPASLDKFLQEREAELEKYRQKTF